MIKNVTKTTLLLLMSWALYGECGSLPLFQSFKVQKQRFSFPKIFSVFNSQGSLGEIKKSSIINSVRSYIWSDSQGNIIATAGNYSTAEGIKIEVFDCSGGKMGSIQGNRVLDDQDYVVAKLQKTKQGLIFLSTYGDGEKVAELGRPKKFRGLRGLLSDVEAVDGRLLVILGVAQIDGVN